MRRNPLKYGLFARDVILPEVDGPGADREFHRLLSALRHHYQPADVMAALDVEELATTLWIKRRALRGLNGAIRKRLESARRTRDEQTRQTKRDVEVLATAEKEALTTTPEDVQSLLLILADVRSAVAKGGTLSEDSSRHLVENFPSIRGGLVELCLTYKLLSELGPELVERAPEKSQKVPSAADCTIAILALLDREGARLQTLKATLEAAAADEREREQLDALRPEQADEVLAEHYIRWQRQADRIRDRLDRQQQQRRGEPLSPTVDVHLHPSE